MTLAAEEFVTPLSISALTAERVYSDLFSRDDEHDVGHIRLSREADLVIVVPATANLIAKMANGLANDLASTILLATNKPGIDCPGHEPVDVGAFCNITKCTNADKRRNSHHRPRGW